MNLGKNVKFTRLLSAVAAGTTDTQAGTAVDMSGWEGVMFVALFGTITANAVTDFHVETGATTSPTDDLADSAVHVAEGDDDHVVWVDVYRPLERYLRPVITRTIANAVIDGIIAMQYGPKVMPTTHDTTTTATGVSLVSAAEGTK